MLEHAPPWAHHPGYLYFVLSPVMMQRDFSPFRPRNAPPEILQRPVRDFDELLVEHQAKDDYGYRQMLVYAPGWDRPTSPLLANHFIFGSVLLEFASATEAYMALNHGLLSMCVDCYVEAAIGQIQQLLECVWNDGRLNRGEFPAADFNALQQLCMQPPQQWYAHLRPQAYAVHRNFIIAEKDLPARLAELQRSRSSVESSFNPDAFRETFQKEHPASILFAANPLSSMEECLKLAGADEKVLKRARELERPKPGYKPQQQQQRLSNGAQPSRTVQGPRLVTPLPSTGNGSKGVKRPLTQQNGGSAKRPALGARGADKNLNATSSAKAPLPTNAPPPLPDHDVSADDFLPPPPPLPPPP